MEYFNNLNTLLNNFYKALMGSICPCWSDSIQCVACNELRNFFFDSELLYLIKSRSKNSLTESIFND